MTDRGLLFDEVAEEYDRARPSYPPELVDAACELLALGPGSRVLEVGSGTGKLTRVLAARGLAVDAVDPGEEMIRVARRHVGDAVRFHHGRFEDVELPGGYEAVFSAAAWHWVDPAVGWAKAARLGNGIALLTHAPTPMPQLLEAWRAVVPEAAEWSWRDPEALWAGALERRDNASEVWAWLTDNPLARPEAADVFGATELRRLPVEFDVTPDRLLAAIRTQSAYLLLDEPRRTRLEALLRDAIGEQATGASLAVLAVARTRHAS